MKILKQFLSLILVTAFLFSFAGCGMKKQPDSEEILAELLPEVNPLRQDITIKAGEEIPAVGEFLKDGYTGSFATDVSAIDTNVSGVYDIVIDVDGTEYTAMLTIEDSAEASRMVSTLMGDNIEARKRYINEHADFNKVDKFADRI